MKQLKYSWHEILRQLSNMGLFWACKMSANITLSDIFLPINWSMRMFRCAACYSDDSACIARVTEKCGLNVYSLKSYIWIRMFSSLSMLHHVYADCIPANKSKIWYCCCDHSPAWSILSKKCDKSFNSGGMLDKFVAWIMYRIPGYSYCCRLHIPFVYVHLCVCVMLWKINTQSVRWCEHDCYCVFSLSDFQRRSLGIAFL